MYATASRGHDATWRLQNEMVLNDRIVSSQRRYGVKLPGYGVKLPGARGSDVPHVPCSEPGEAAAAERMARRIAERLGMDAGELRDVLEALGLTEPPAAPPRRAGTPVPTGECPQCERTVHLRKDGTLIAHTRLKNAPPGTPRCPGTHTPARTEVTH